MNSIWLYFHKISTYSFILPLSIGLYGYKKYNKAEKILTYLLFIVLLIESINWYLSSQGINTYPVIRIYTIAEFILMLTYYKYFFNSARFNQLYYLLMVFFFIVALADVLWVNNIKKSDTLAAPVESFILIILALSAFYWIMKYAPYENLLGTSFFWINTAYLIYFAGTLFVFAFLNVILKNFPGKYGQVYMINTILNPVSYILISVGLWKARKR